MSYAEDIIKLRMKLADAVGSGALDTSKESFEAVLIQIMNDAERNRQNCVTQAENFRKQASTIDGQAAGFASVVSIVYNVINGYINAAERSKLEEARVEEERLEREEALKEQPVNIEETSSKKLNKPYKKKNG